MDIKILALRNQSLLTCGIAEEVAIKIREEHKQEWLASRTSPASLSIARHNKQAGFGLSVASVGMIGATGIAIAGGPVALGVTAFAIGTAAAGKAIYHIAAEKIAELKQERRANTSHAEAYTPLPDDELMARARKVSAVIWDETLSELVQMQSASNTVTPPKSRAQRPAP